MAELSTSAHGPPATRSNGHEALEAVERIAVASERAASARIERAAHSAMVAGRGMVRSIVWIAVAAAIATLGWVTLMLGAVLLLSPLLGPGVALAAAGLAQVLVGAGIAYAASPTAGASAESEPSEKALS